MYSGMRTYSGCRSCSVSESMEACFEVRRMDSGCAGGKAEDGVGVASEVVARAGVGPVFRLGRRDLG